jgi:hypothetical protein
LTEYPNEAVLAVLDFSEHLSESEAEFKPHVKGQ